MKKYTLTSVLLLNSLAGAFARKKMTFLEGRILDFRGDGFYFCSADFARQIGTPPEPQNRARREAPRPILGLLGVPILRAKSAENSKIHHP